MKNLARYSGWSVKPRPQCKTKVCAFAIAFSAVLLLLGVIGIYQFETGEEIPGISYRIRIFPTGKGVVQVLVPRVGYNGTQDFVYPLSPKSYLDNALTIPLAVSYDEKPKFSMCGVRSVGSIRHESRDSTEFAFAVFSKPGEFSENCSKRELQLSYGILNGVGGMGDVKSFRHQLRSDRGRLSIKNVDVSLEFPVAVSHAEAQVQLFSLGKTGKKLIATKQAQLNTHAIKLEVLESVEPHEGLWIEGQWKTRFQGGSYAS